MSSIPEIADPGNGGMADQVRTWCRDNRALWQRIPYLALQAATGPQDEFLGLAFMEGLWPLGRSDDMPTAYVDCATGEIVDASDPEMAATDEVVMDLLQGDVRLMDPQRVIPELEGRMAAHGGTHAAWRAEMARDLGLQPHRPFTRNAAEGPGLA